MLDRARETMDRALQALDKASQGVIEELSKSKSYDIKLGSHLAWVTRQVGEVTSAIRQLEKHDRVMSRTPEQRFRLVCEYIRSEASPIQRAELAAVIAELDQGRSLLS